MLHDARPCQPHPPVGAIHARGLDYLVQSIGRADELGVAVYGEAIGPAQVLGVEDGPVGGMGRIDVKGGCGGVEGTVRDGGEGDGM